MDGKLTFPSVPSPDYFLGGLFCDLSLTDCDHIHLISGGKVDVNNQGEEGRWDPMFPLQPAVGHQRSAEASVSLHFRPLGQSALQ